MLDMTTVDMTTIAYAVNFLLTIVQIVLKVYELFRTGK